jgi:hypothetical protein
MDFESIVEIVDNRIVAALIPWLGLDRAPSGHNRNTQLTALNGKSKTTTATYTV